MGEFNSRLFKGRANCSSFLPFALVFVLTFFMIIIKAGAQDTTVFRLEGLIKPVIIRTDRWGVSHIEAQSEADLFFAQGYQAARDRLFQFELFRRQATGTVSEMLGPRELDRDIGARLFKFRGDMNRELKHYHPRGEVIIKAFVNGINARIKETIRQNEKLPIEFQLLGIKPSLWTPEDVISRHNGLLGNVQTEVQTARWSRQIGEERVVELMNYHPHTPDLSLDSLLTREALKEDILKWYNAFRRPVRFQKEDLTGSLNLNLNLNLNPNYAEASTGIDYNSEGSNNWVISGNKTQSGYPIMANDPHRAITVPSLRYIVHLKAPGWNVIGGGEPILPGVSIGHNEYGAWGLTIFQTDMEDMYVYKIDPQNRNRYMHHGQWLMFKTLPDTIRIKGQSPITLEHRYSVHGPVVFVDTLRNLAYAIRCAWLEPGSAPYLASLRMNQARSWTEFRQACAYSFVPAENMVWADRKGNIGWQTVGLAPVRKNHSGMVPVMDNPRHEWNGYQPVLERPGAYNPREGFIATANENLTPLAYPHMHSIGYNWADPYRGMRIREVLQDGRRFSIPDMAALQTDYLSLPARQLVPLLLAVDMKDTMLENYKQNLSSWDFILSPRSAAAGLYILTERRIEEKLLALFLPENDDGIKTNDVSINNLSSQAMMRWLWSPDGRFGPDPLEKRNEIIVSSFRDAVDKMISLFGIDLSQWKYGHESFKHVRLSHALSVVADTGLSNKFNTLSLLRGGNGNTVNSTGDVNNQASGASFRIIVDCADWDHTLAINTPGQQGDPDQPHYKDLFQVWAKDQYFPLFFSEGKLKGVTESVTKLAPLN